MSNYNSQIQENNTDLQLILNTINELPDASADPALQTKTVTPTTSVQNVTPDSGYDGLSEVTVNAMPTATQATPSISVNSSGLITASATQTAGYVSAGTKSATKQLTIQAAQTITPATTNKTIASGRYLTGTQTIKGDANLKAENIKSGVSIFGVAGSHSGAEDLNAELTAQEGLISQLSNILDSKASGSSGGSIETCTVTFLNGLSPLGVIYIDTMGEARSYLDLGGLGEVEIPTTFDTLKNSLIVALSFGDESNVTMTNAKIISTNYGGEFYSCFVIQVTGDTTSIEFT